MRPESLNANCVIGKNESILNQLNAQLMVSIEKYTYFTMAKISLIQSYLATGYTLKAAVAKTKAHDQVAAAIHKLVKERLVDINPIKNGYQFDLGSLADQPQTHVLAIIKVDQPTQLILKKN